MQMQIIPPYIIEHISKNGSQEEKAWAQKHVSHSHKLRLERSKLFEAIPSKLIELMKGKDRQIFNANNKPQIPGKLIRQEGAKPTKDTPTNEAYDYLGATYDFYREVLGRKSIDNANMPLIATVNYREDETEGYPNAFWNGSQMIFGNGDDHLPESKRLFNRFTIDLDVIGHELTHGVVQYEISLKYQDQAGALHEHFADAFGSMILQWKNNIKSEKADWLIGKDLFTKNVKAKAIRSMKAPGTAYNDPKLGGKDPQPSHMKDFQKISWDNGGVHINSGIPNHAFYLAAIELGGYSFEKLGSVWYEAIKGIKSNATFIEFANSTIKVSKNKEIEKVIKEAWDKVGIKV